jgi:predicted ATPase/Tfp pilus assembly protein PilF
MRQRLVRVRRLFNELKRRKVVRVGLAYGVLSAGAIQVADPVLAAVGLPPETMTLVLVLIVAGFPLALFLSWAYELVPDPGSPADLDDTATGEHAHGDDHAAGTTATGDAADGDASRTIRRHRTPRSLPAPTTPFIGRETELRELLALLASVDTRLVTVTGPGGIGKTRLAVRAAETLSADLQHGVIYVPLSGLASTDLLVPAIAEALGIVLSRREDPLEELVDFLREKQMLLLLDNFERLIDGAAQLAALMEQAPAVRILVTSLERLNLHPETLLALEGLPTSGGEQAAAVQLFVSGARRLDRHFEIDGSVLRTVTRICEAVGGMPLAIELASSWVRVMSVDEILTELERGLDILSSAAPDLPERHRSMRAAFDGSWRLLTPVEQRALARLSVFRSRFDRAAALAVANADLALLRMLLDKSLLGRADRCFIMLDVVRQYAGERLQQNAVDASVARDAHMSYHIDLLRRLEPDLLRSDPAAVNELAGQIDEVRAAWGRAIETRNADVLLLACDGLFHFYEARGWAREGVEAFARAEAAWRHERSAEGDASYTQALLMARLATRLGALMDRLGARVGAESLLRRGLDQARALKDRSEIALALRRLGTLQFGMGDYDQAEAALCEAGELAREMSDPHGVGFAMSMLGTVAWGRGRYDDAQRLYTDSLEILNEARNLEGMWMTVNNLGVLAAGRNDYDEAERRFQEALTLQDELRNQRSMATVLHNLGSAARQNGNHADARKYLEAGLAISEEFGYRSLLALTLANLAELSIASGDLNGAAPLLARSLRTALEVRSYPHMLEALLTLAELREAQDDVAGAARLAGVVAVHPVTDDETRARAQDRLDRLGVSAEDTTSEPDLDQLVTEILKNDRHAFSLSN